MRAALLGLAHPHSALLLATLDTLAEVDSITLWDDSPATAAKPELPPSRKVDRVTTDLDSVLAQPDLRFAVVCVPTCRAAAVAGQVLAAGKHLLAEKPVGLTSAEIDALRETADRGGLVAGVLYVRRAHPCMIAARRWIQSGAIGPLFSAEARFLTTQVRFRSPESWLFRRSESGGGILSWLGCHCLDLFRHVTGDEITEVGARLATRSPEGFDVEDDAVLALRFRSGAVGSLHAAYCLAFSGGGYANSAGYDSYFALNGRSGRIVWPDLEPRLLIESPPEPGQSARREEHHPSPASTSYGGAAGEDFFRRFIAAVRDGGPPPASLDDALQIARIIEAARLSDQTGRFCPLS